MPQIEKQPGYEVKKGRIPDADLRGLCERVKSKNENAICIRYDQKFLSWRVREHPFLKYDEYQVFKAAKLRAYAFVTLFESVASISDLLSEDSYATSLLLSTIVKDYARKAQRFRFIGNPKDSLAQDLFDQLRQFGFSVATNLVLSVRHKTGGKYEQIFDIRNWHVNGLWTEGYRY